MPHLYTDLIGCEKDSEAYGVYWNGGANDQLMKNSCCMKYIISDFDFKNAGIILRMADDKA